MSAILATAGTQLDISSLSALGAVSEGSSQSVRILSEPATDALTAKSRMLPSAADLLQLGEDGADTIVTSHEVGL
ncbi:hypothetical protein [Amycolatopsis sp.]|uniref:hypothetical protein n=1 Tax=Amycolatopsis sp. TaxID=37632 RepID=UPI002E05B3A1|nr:hypothetical protein [Amycolatopsis sp.]